MAGVEGVLDFGVSWPDTYTHSDRVPAELVRDVGHRDGPAGRQVVGTGLSLALHRGQERGRHVVLVDELEAQPGVGDHGLEQRQR